MNKLTKIGVSALAGSLAMASANAEVIFSFYWISFIIDRR